MKINEKIQMYRKQAGLSQEALAEEIKVSRQAISKWESGIAQPTLDNCKELCRVFKIGLNQLCQDEKEYETIKVKKESFKLPSILLLILAMISLSLNGYMYYQLKQSKEDMASLNEKIEAVRSLIYQSQTEIIIPQNNIENSLQSFDILGKLNDDRQVDLNLSIRLTKQNEKTQVGCSIKSLDDEYITETSLQADYSFLVSSKVDLVDEVHIECYKLEEDEITYLISEDYAIKPRFVQDVDVYIDEYSYQKPYENELILAIDLLNQYGVFQKDSKGNVLSKLSYTISLVKENEIIDSYSNILEEKMVSLNEDSASEMGQEMTIFTYFKVDETILKEDIRVVLKLVLNDLDTIEKEVMLSDLKRLNRAY